MRTHASEGEQPSTDTKCLHASRDGRASQAPVTTTLHGHRDWPQPRSRSGLLQDAGAVMDDHELARLLSNIGPRGRDVLRRLMRAEQFERDDFATALERQPMEVGRDLAELLDLASLNPEVRRRVARVLGELEASSSD